MQRAGKVTVVGAGFYGSTTAQRLAEYDIFSKVVLTDIVEGKPDGIALDINQSRPIEGFETKVTGVTTGSNGAGYEKTAGSGIVVITDPRRRTVTTALGGHNDRNSHCARNRDIAPGGLHRLCATNTPFRLPRTTKRMRTWWGLD